MNVLATISVLHIRPFAFSNWSVWTIEGMNVWAELSYNTSAIPISSVARMMTPYRIMLVGMAIVSSDTTSGPGSDALPVEHGERHGRVRTVRAGSTRSSACGGRGDR